MFRIVVRSAVPWILDSSSVQTYRHFQCPNLAGFSPCSVFLVLSAVPPILGISSFQTLAEFQFVFRILVRSAVPFILDISSVHHLAGFSTCSVI